MNKTKKAKLEKYGWKVGSTSEFLGPACEGAHLNSEIDKTWVKETLRRKEEIKFGKVKVLSHEDVFGKYRKPAS